MPISKTGIWLTEDGDVVYEKPRGRATQLAAKGGEIGATTRAHIAAQGLTVDLPEADEPDKPQKDVTVETATEPDAVETGDLQAKPARKASKKG